MLLFNLYGPQSPQKLLLFALALFALSFFQMITKPNETDDNNSTAIALHPGLPQPAVASWVGWVGCMLARVRAAAAT